MGGPSLPLPFPTSSPASPETTAVCASINFFPSVTALLTRREKLYSMMQASPSSAPTVAHFPSSAPPSISPPARISLTRSAKPRALSSRQSSPVTTSAGHPPATTGTSSTGSLTLAASYTRIPNRMRDPSLLPQRAPSPALPQAPAWDTTPIQPSHFFSPSST